MKRFISILLVICICLCGCSNRFTFEIHEFYDGLDWNTDISGIKEYVKDKKEVLPIENGYCFLTEDFKKYGNSEVSLICEKETLFKVMIVIDVTNKKAGQLYNRLVNQVSDIIGSPTEETESMYKGVFRNTVYIVERQNEKVILTYMKR